MDIGTDLPHKTREPIRGDSAFVKATNISEILSDDTPLLAWRGQ